MNVAMLIGGLYWPRIFAFWGVVYMISRMGYIWGYSKSPGARAPFIPPIMLTQLMMPFVAMGSCVALALNTFKDAPTMHAGFGIDEMSML